MGWQFLGWIEYRAGNWNASVEALEESCKLQAGGTGDSGQWSVLALAHAQLAAQEDLPEQQREHHQSQARHWYDQTDQSINWRVRPDDEVGQAIWALVENELFGHAQGAYTDARQAGRGVIEQARGGTLLLDEIEALSPKGQIILLRFLQDQEFRPLGGDGLRRGDVRVIAAGNSPIEDLVEAGSFRRDLLYRLKVLNITVPPLRERPEDIAPISRHILAKLRSRYGGPQKLIHPGAAAWLECRPWPGNVRELENLLHRAYVMSESDTLTLGPEMGELSDSAGDSDFRRAKTRVIASFEREYLVWVMDRAKGNVTQAARIAGKERRALGRLLKKHRLGPGWS
jgi:DNA-binding NtrC family response regulator